MSDIDGMTNNIITFEIQGNYKEDEIFGFEMLPSDQTTEYFRLYSLM